MLQSLTIRNIAVIEQLHIEFEKGFSVLTGETGAGKSILLDSLEFALGNRIQPSKLIREGESEASVTVVIDSPPIGLHSFFEEHGLDCDSSLIIRRIITKEGKSKAFINDQPISISLLSTIGPSLVEIHGQFDHLLDTSAQQKALDQYIHLPTTEIVRAYEKWKEAENILKEAENTSSHKEERLEELNFLIAELEHLDPKLGEEEELLMSKQRGRNIEHIQNILKMVEAFSKEPCNVEGQLLTLQRHLEKQDISTLCNLKTAAHSLLISLRDMQEESSQIRLSIEHTPLSLNQIEERLYMLRQVARKHKVTSNELNSILEKLRAEKESLENGTLSLETLKKDAQIQKEKYVTIAQENYILRKKGAETLADEIKKALDPLKLSHAIFVVSFQELPESQWTSSGVHRIEFHVSTNPGISPGPLLKVASGGELSRIMLALKSILKEKNNIPTLIFDEIDIGIGGAVAAAMGEQLAKLARNSQILSITHSPQMASYADHHLTVKKVVQEEKTSTAVYKLEGDERLEEISRMLSGKTVTAHTRAVAAELLKDKVHT